MVPLECLQNDGVKSFSEVQEGRVMYLLLLSALLFVPFVPLCVQITDLIPSVESLSEMSWSPAQSPTTLQVIQHFIVRYHWGCSLCCWRLGFPCILKYDVSCNAMAQFGQGWHQANFEQRINIASYLHSKILASAHTAEQLCWVTQTVLKCTFVILDQNKKVASHSA